MDRRHAPRRLVVHCSCSSFVPWYSQDVVLVFQRNTQISILFHIPWSLPTLECPIHGRNVRSTNNSTGIYLSNFNRPHVLLRKFVWCRTCSYTLTEQIRAQEFRRRFWSGRIPISNRNLSHEIRNQLKCSEKEILTRIQSLEKDKKKLEKIYD